MLFFVTPLIGMFKFKKQYITFTKGNTNSICASKNDHTTLYYYYNGTKKMLLLRAWYLFVRFNYTLKTDLV